MQRYQAGDCFWIFLKPYRLGFLLDFLSRLRKPNTVQLFESQLKMNPLQLLKVESHLGHRRFIRSGRYRVVLYHYSMPHGLFPVEIKWPLQIKRTTAYHKTTRLSFSNFYRKTCLEYIFTSKEVIAFICTSGILTRAVPMRRTSGARWRCTCWAWHAMGSQFVFLVSSHWAWHAGLYTFVSRVIARLAGS